MEEGGKGGFLHASLRYFFLLRRSKIRETKRRRYISSPPPSTYSCIIPKYSSSSSCFLRAWQFISCVGRLPTSLQIPFFPSCASRPCSIPQRAHNWQSENGAQKDGEGAGQCFGFSGRGNEVGVLEGRGGGVQKGGQFLIRRVRPSPLFD